MKRIQIIGSSGSGKSTLAQQLGRIYKLPVFHLDNYFWNANWVETPQERFDDKVTQLTQQEDWVIDGNYSRTLDLRMERADLVIYLDMPRYLCMYRIFKRRMKYHKKTRPDLAAGCEEKLDWEFVEWVWNYRKRSRDRILERLSQVSKVTEVAIVTTPEEVRAFVARLERATKG